MNEVDKGKLHKEPSWAVSRAKSLNIETMLFVSGNSVHSENDIMKQTEKR